MKLVMLNLIDICLIILVCCHISVMSNSEMLKILSAIEAVEKKVLKPISYLIQANLDPWSDVRSHESKRSIVGRTVQESKQLRKDSCKYYGLKPKFCMVLGITANVVSAHIWPKSKSQSLELFNLSPNDVDSPRNILRLAKPIEISFDEGKLSFRLHSRSNASSICVSSTTSAASTTFASDVSDAASTTFAASPYVSVAASASSTMEVVLLCNDEVWLNTKVQDELDITFRNLEGRPLLLGSNHTKPFSRLLARHLSANAKEAQKKGWLAPQNLSDLEIWSQEMARNSISVGSMSVFDSIAEHVHL